MAVLKKNSPPLGEGLGEGSARTFCAMVQMIVQKADTLLLAQPKTPPLTPPQGEGNLC